MVGTRPVDVITRSGNSPRAGNAFLRRGCIRPSASPGRRVDGIAMPRPAGYPVAGVVGYRGALARSPHVIEVVQPPAARPPLLEVIGLSKRFGPLTGVRDVSFR